MREAEEQVLDGEVFHRVWRRVMPEDRPDCPFTVEQEGQTEARELTRTAVAGPPDRQPQVAPVRQGKGNICLGAESLGELPALTRFLALTLSLEQAYRVLGPGGFSARLAQEKAVQVGRLATACFLITGKRPKRPETLGTNGLSGASGLRECYRAEQELARELLLAGTGDPCLASLYRELAGEDQRSAGQIREQLERTLFRRGITGGSARYGSNRGG